MIERSTRVRRGWIPGFEESVSAMLVQVAKTVGLPAIVAGWLLLVLPASDSVRMSVWTAATIVVLAGMTASAWMARSERRLRTAIQRYTEKDLTKSAVLNRAALAE
jgi:hypothetical protein